MTGLSGKKDLRSSASSEPTTPLPTTVKLLALAMRRRSVSKACLRCAMLAPSVLMSLWYEVPVHITWHRDRVTVTVRVEGLGLGLR